jgi:parallel beta-helix repeat protein
MRREFKLFAILLTIIFGSFSFPYQTLFQKAEATYTEGFITQDTIWTLVDSPIVVSKNTTILSNATLTIEPEVQVRFGGHFSLIVEGKLVANGTKDKMITFTSNKYEREAGDWGTIEFKGAQLSSLVYCTIEYGTNGISVNGALSVQKSLVRLNSKSGTLIAGGNVEVKDNEIVNNALSGIYITGDSRITVENNIITSNEDGITLTGDLTSEISILQNNISFNNQGGVLLEATAYGNTAILNNILTANSYGFHVSTGASTFITGNYIIDNTVGIFYEQGATAYAHTAYFNDIYDNDLGMDVQPNEGPDEIVNAQHNYWGDESGPYHESLNPRGMGNPVVGDAVNLDFKFFLTATIDYNNAHPTAILWTDKALVAPNQNVTFIGTDSYDDGRIDQYFFDFGNQTNSGWTTLSLFNHSYSSTGTYNVELTVKDDFGAESTNSTVVLSVQDLATLEASITLNVPDHTVNYNEETSVSVHVANETGAVENAIVTLFSVKGGNFTSQSGLTNSTGYFTTTFTAPNVTEITSVRIIARASKSGYADGSDHEYLNVLPPISVQVTAEPATIKSEETAIITVHASIGFEQPVADGLLILSSDYGNLSATIGVTDVNGSATFLFTAPQTLSQIGVTITATAVKMGYAEGQGQGTIIVEAKTLVVHVTAEPTIIVSEATSTITAHITCDAAPISGATVLASSDSDGSFIATTEITDSNGKAAFLFTAPQTTILLDVTIGVTGAKSGYVNGEGQIAITIVPKVLALQATAEPDVTISEAKMNVTVSVTYAMIPVPDANVTMTSENGGSFSPTTEITDIYGNVTFTFTAPQVNAPSNITIKAQASKNGYVDGQKLLNVTVNPGILTVEITPAPYTIASTESSSIAVSVMSNGTPVQDVLVTMSSTYCNFSVSTNMTDSEGYCTFIFSAPRTNVQLTDTIVANATKNGYVDCGNKTTITVTPAPTEETIGGWPIIMILLIIIPIAIVVVLVVLIKLKVITFSTQEES